MKNISPSNLCRVVVGRIILMSFLEKKRRK